MAPTVQGREHGDAAHGTYMEPMNATSNQKARPWTSPECSMWNLKGISILEGRAAAAVGKPHTQARAAARPAGRWELPVQVTLFGF